jgi:hypothetical protein
VSTSPSSAKIVFVVSESLLRAEDDPIDDPTPQKGFAEGVWKKKGGLLDSDIVAIQGVPTLATGVVEPVS